MNTYDNLNKRCELVIRCLPNAPFRHTVAGLYAELFSEIDRLDRVIAQAKKEVLNRANDGVLLEILSQGSAVSKKLSFYEATQKRGQI